MDYIIPLTFGHGVVNVGDLPIPFDIVLNTSALVVLITFVYLKVSWKESIIAHREEIFDDKQSLFGKLFGFLILFLLVAPGVISNESAKTSIAPLMLWVFLWIGVPVLGLLFGDIYAKFNPLNLFSVCLLYTSPSPRDNSGSRMPSSA